MREELLQDPRWYLGIPLRERASAARRRPADDAGVVDRARAARRLARWQSRGPLREDAVLAERLALDGLTREGIERLLGEPASEVAARFDGPPPWLRALVAAIDAGPAPGPASAERLSFAVAAAPLVRKARLALEHGAAGIAARSPHAPFRPEQVADLFMPPLRAELDTMLARTLVLEMHVARLEGRLAADSPEERFKDYLAGLREPGALLDLLREYPVLGARLVACADTWREVSLEILERLAEDWDALRRAMSPDADPGHLTACRAGAGDRHRGGRTVAILTFSSGLRLVYKPRSLAADVHFQDLVRWLDERGASPPLRTLRVLDRGAYGWMEHVAPAGCAALDEIRRFYERQGAYLALMYALNATDVHFENIIAAGEHPVIVDLESLLHPHFAVGEVTRADEIAAQALAGSVTRVGLLPRRGWATDESEGIDFSGLGGSAGQLTPRPAQVWEGVGTDEMRLVRKRVPIRGSDNRPTLGGADVDPAEHAASLRAGFTRMYRLLVERRAELLAEGGPLSRFAADELRVILRPTHLYHLLFRESYHPSLLRDALERDIFFDRLWGMLERAPYLRRVIAAEHAELWRDDIPSFTTRPTSRDVWTGAGERIPDLFPASGMELVEQRLARLGEEDLARQLWFIDASFTALSASAAEGRTPGYPVRPPREAATRARLLDAALRAGERLAATALQGAGDAAWIGVAPAGERAWGLRPLGLDLYSGLTGIALFLGQLGAIAREERFTSLAGAALSTVRQKVRAGNALRSIGAFGDLGGALYALMHLGALWGEQALLDEAESLLDALPGLLARDRHFDLLKGAAGGILSLLALHDTRPTGRALEAAIACGDHLLKAAQPGEHGLGWVTPLGPRPLTGFSHGTAGIAWALLALATASGEERFRGAAISAIAAERAEYCPEARNWRDLREVSDPRGFMVTFCHGAPGIALGRMRSLPHLDTPDLRAEIRAALETTLASGFGQGHSLCHGDLGNLDILALAAEALADPALAEHVARLTASILESIEERGFLCGVPGGVETPGLMTGLAGIGHGLLRLAEPRRVPSVLALTPPSPRSA